MLNKIPTDSDNQKWIDTSISDIKVTLGSVSQTQSGHFSVNGPKVRLHRKTGMHQYAMLQFRYKGPSKQTSKLNSGSLIRQVGLKMRTKDPCNLIYVMWRIEPKEEILLTLKSNPGKSTHLECGAMGYSNIGRVSLEDLGISAANNDTHSLIVRINEFQGTYRCFVEVDNQTILNDLIDASIISSINGSVGFRSDNGRFTFKLLVSDEMVESLNTEPSNLLEL